MDTDNYVFQRQLGRGVLSVSGGFKTIADWPAYAKTLPTIAEELEKLPRPHKMSDAVYVIHMPPANLGLDVCTGGIRVGSKAIYDFFLKNQPRLSFHGHIHESPGVTGRWKADLGRTVCVQPGQAKSFTYVTIDLGKMEIVYIMTIELRGFNIEVALKHLFKIFEGYLKSQSYRSKLRGMCLILRKRRKNEIYKGKKRSAGYL